MNLNNLQKALALPFLRLPRSGKRAFALFVDVVLCAVAVWLAIFLRTGDLPQIAAGTATATAISIGLAIPAFVGFGLYRAIFRYRAGQLLAIGKR